MPVQSETGLCVPWGTLVPRAECPTQPYGHIATPPGLCACTSKPSEEGCPARERQPELLWDVCVGAHV